MPAFTEQKPSSTLVFFVGIALVTQRSKVYPFIPYLLAEIGFMGCCEGSHPISCLVGSENWILRSNQPLYITDTPLRNKVYTLIPLEVQCEVFLWFFPPQEVLRRRAHRRFGWRLPVIEKSTFLFEPFCFYSFILTPEVMFTLGTSKVLPPTGE